MYCSHCGKENNSKICVHCGVKQKKSNNFCRFCGNTIEEKCKKCPSCHEPVKAPFIFTIISVVKYVLAIFFIADGFFGILNSFDYKTAGNTSKMLIFTSLTLIVGIAMITVTAVINKKYCSNTKARKINILITVVLIVLGASCVSLNNSAEQSLIDAEEILKIEEQYQQFVDMINDSQWYAAINYAKEISLKANIAKTDKSEEYENYSDYAWAMFKYHGEKYCIMSDALSYLEACPDDFLDVQKYENEIKDFYKKFAGLYKNVSSGIDIYLSINENGEIAFCSKDKLDDPNYADELQKEFLATSNIEGWTPIITGYTISDTGNDLERSFEFYIFSIQNSENIMLTVHSKSIFASTGSVYEGEYTKIGDALPKKN